MKVADFIFDFLAKKGADTVFMVSGGQAMFLVDAVGRNSRLKVVCTHHEQAAGMAAEAYGRITGKPGIALVTAGPGGMNVINGLVGGWTDSSPMFVISGQSALSCVRYQQKTSIRQYGIQGIYIQPFVEKATKFFVTVEDPAKILFYMQKAYHLALSGRPGPVWIDVPLDIQGMEVPKKLLGEYPAETPVHNNRLLKSQVARTMELLAASQRPLFLVGQGVRIAGALNEFHSLVEKLKISVLTSRLGIDLIHSDSPYYVGRPGNYGERAAHFAIQNADLILSVGCRLASATVGHNSRDFGRNAVKVVVDIDTEELEKPGVDIAIKVNDDARRFLSQMLEHTEKESCSLPDCGRWLDRCNDWKRRYPVVLDSYRKETPVNSYHFSDVLSRMADKNDMVLVDTGSCFHVACQAWKVKQGQRFLTTGGLSSMGYWVAGIGACLANNRKNTIVITGDGSLQMNLQELATLKHYNLPVKVIVFNNNGYLLIRQTQKNFMEGRLVGEGPETGVWCPDSLRIAEAYGIKGVRIESPEGMEEKIREVLEYDGPVVCDVITPEWQLIIPRLSSEKRSDGTLVPKPYEDMYPFLDREELEENMKLPDRVHAEDESWQ